MVRWVCDSRARLLCDEFAARARLVKLRVETNRARRVKNPDLSDLGGATEVLYPVGDPLVISRFY